MLPTISTLIRATTVFRSDLATELQKGVHPRSAARSKERKKFICESLLDLYYDYNGSDTLEGETLKRFWEDLGEEHVEVLLEALRHYHERSKEDLEFKIQAMEKARAAEGILVIMRGRS